MTNKEYREKIHRLSQAMTKQMLDNSSLVMQGVNVFSADAVLFLFTMSYSDTITNVLEKSLAPQEFEILADDAVANPTGPVHRGYKQAVEDVNALYQEYKEAVSDI